MIAQDKPQWPKGSKVIIIRCKFVKPIILKPKLTHLLKRTPTNINKYLTIGVLEVLAMTLFSTIEKMDLTNLQLRLRMLQNNLEELYKIKEVSQVERKRQVPKSRS